MIQSTIIKLKKSNEFCNISYTAASNVRRSYWQSALKELVDAQLSPKNVESRLQTAKTSDDRHKILPFPGTSVFSNRLRRILLPFLSRSFQGCRHHKSWRKQSVSLSKESSCLFPPFVFLLYFSFTRDKESIEARIFNEENREGGKRDVTQTGRGACTKLQREKGEKEVYIAGRFYILQFQSSCNTVLSRLWQTVEAFRRDLSVSSLWRCHRIAINRALFAFCS